MVLGGWTKERGNRVGEWIYTSILLFYRYHWVFQRKGCQALPVSLWEEIALGFPVFGRGLSQIAPIQVASGEIAHKAFAEPPFFLKMRPHFRPNLLDKWYFHEKSS